MNTDRREDPIMMLGNLNGAIERAGTSAAPDRENAFQPRFASASNDLRAVLIELRTVEMCVRIDVQAGPLFQFCAHRNIFQEARQHRLAFFADGSSDDHSVRLEPAKFAWLQIGY